MQAPHITTKTKIFSSIFVLSIILMFVFAQATSPAEAAVPLEIRIIAAPNLVVDSNVMSPSTQAPRVATVIGEFCNYTGADLDNVVGYIGNYVDDTPGVYPVKDDVTIGGQLYSGKYSFTHLGGTADGSRYMGSIANGTCKYQYWSFVYPNKANNGTIPTWGTSVKPDDDLSLDFDIWAKAGSVFQQTKTHTMTMRNEISAMANKIKPNGNPSGYWFNTDTSSVLPGQTITTNGILYRLGNVNKGFDNDLDGLPDFNAWLQPFGDPSYDPSCFRLLGTTGVLTVTTTSGDIIMPFKDQLYFTNLPPSNTNVSGEVFYTFMALSGSCTIPISPYQEVASGSDNEKFNGDYGTGIPGLITGAPQVSLLKSGPGVQAENTTVLYEIGFANSSTTAKAGLTLSSGVYGNLVISDTVPVGLQYVANSANNNNTLPTGNSFTYLYSVDSGKTWTSTDPGNVTSTSINKVIIQWVLNSPLDQSGSGSNTGTVRYQAQIVTGYVAAGNPPFIENCAATSFGDAAPFAESCATTMVPGNNSIGDKVWNDVNANGLDDGEAGLSGVTVSLYYDKNNDSILDETDPLITTAVANGSGIYSFPNLPDARYIVTVDSSTAPDGYRPTNPVSGQIAVNLISDGDIANTTTDFGLAPALRIDKSLVATAPTASNGTLTYKIDLINQLPGSGSSQRACTYTLWGSTVDTAQSGSGGTGLAWQNESSATGSPNTSLAVAPLTGNGETLSISGFSLGNTGDTITKVELLLAIQKIGAATGTLNATVINYGNSTILGALITDDDISTYATSLTTRSYNLCTSPAACAASVFGSWATYGGNVKSIKLIAQKSGSPVGDLGLDAVGLRITTDGSCGGSSTDITHLPLIDTFDTGVLDFVSASVSPDLDTPDGTLTWNNLGTLYAGGTRTLYATFKVTAGKTEAVNNLATSTGAKFGDGQPTNSPVSDNAELIGVVGDRVWFDINANRIQDAGESGIAGAVVELWQDTGNGSFSTAQDTLLATATTDANGNYLFSGLTLDTLYFVRVLSVPTGYTGVSDRNATGFTNVHAFTPTSSNIVDISYDLGYDTSTANRGGVYGYIWNDVDGDGSREPATGELGLSSVVVTLCTGTPPTCASQGTQTTNADGFYQFTNLAAAANYFIQVTTPAGTTQTFEYGIAVCPAGCDGSSDNFAIAANAIAGPINMGYRRIGTSMIGDLIFRDWNGDGLQGDGEEGLSGVTVKLYLDNDNDGLVGSSDYLFDTQVTNDSGSYLFSSLPAGNFLVVVTSPSGHVQTKDPSESGVCSVCDSKSTQTTDGSNPYLTHDYAYRPTGVLSIGDTVWADKNGDGVQGSGETGIAGITVWLYEDANDDNEYNPGVDALVQTAVTDSSGKYLFTGLLGSTNYVVLVDSADEQLPIDSNGIYMPSTPTTIGVNLVAANVDTADFGFMPRSSISGLVWKDNDGDGGWDSSEPGIPLVWVRLYADANNDGSPDGGAVASQQTDTKGKFLFSSLDPGNYIVVVDETSGALSGYTQTGDPDSQDIPCAGLECDATNLLEGFKTSDGTDYYGLQVGQNDASSIFGYKPAGLVIGDKVWIDMANYGVVDASEPGIPFVYVNLYANLTCTGLPTATTETDENGEYSFAGLLDGDYCVKVDTTDPDFPTGLVNTYDPDGGTASQAATTLSGSNDLTRDFGYRFSGTGSINGIVWHDTNKNLGIDGGEPVTYEGVTVYLVRCINGCGGSDDLLLGSTTTIAGGIYNFPDLGAGSYRVIVNPNVPTLQGLTTTTGTAYTDVVVAEGAATQRHFGFYSDLDFGDLPASYSRTLLGEDGPRHLRTGANNPTLGAGATTEADGVTSDTSSADDEDTGVVRAGVLWSVGAGGSINVDVSSCLGTCYLSGWVDWNDDKDFNNTGERILLDYPVVNGANPSITFAIPTGTGIAGGAASTFNARFRLYATSTNGLARPTGLASTGEVEDYQWNFGPTAVTLQSFLARTAAPVVWAAPLALLSLGLFLVIRRRQKAG